MLFLMWLTRCRTWWLAKRRLHKTLVIAVMVGFVFVPLLWFMPRLLNACATTIFMIFALFVLGTVPKDTF